MKKFLILPMVAFLLFGCGTGYGLKKVETQMESDFHLNQNESAIVFYRSMSAGGGPAIIFEVTDDQPQFVTISSIGTKIFYKTSPGKHIYLMDGDFGYFMDANLEGGKIYYVYISRRIGWARDRFIFEPVSPSELKSADVTRTISKCDWYENSPEGEQLFSEKKPYIIQRYQGLIRDSAAQGWSKATKLPPDYGVNRLVE